MSNPHAQVDQTAHDTAAATAANPDALRELVREQVEAGGERGRRAVSTWLRDVRLALSDAGTQLETDGHAVTALCARTAAARLGDLSGYVDSHSLGDLADGYAGLADRRPLAAIGLAFAAGLGTAALLQARGRMSSGDGRRTRVSA